MPVIRLRSGERPRDDDDLLIHMGAGAADSVLNQVLRTYDDYRAVTPSGEGLFAVSVFAVVDGVSRGQILSAMPHGQHGTATFGAVRRVFELLATAIEDPDMPAEIAVLQPVHYDIVLPRPPETPSGRLTDLRREQRAALEQSMRPIIEESLLPLFVPRLRTYPDA